MQRANLKKHLAVEELVIAGDEVASVMAVQLILLSRLGDWKIKMVVGIKRFEGIGG